MRSEGLVDTDREELLALLSVDLRHGLYVEIGHGVRPYPLARNLVNRQFTKESPYFGIEPYPFLPITGVTLQGVLAENPAPEYVKFIEGVGQNLPFRDGSVQEIYMRDVMLSVRMNTSDKLQILREAKRVLHPATGILILNDRDAEIRLNEGYDGQPFWRRYAELGVMLDATGFQRKTLSSNEVTFRNVPFSPLSERNPLVVAQPKERSVLLQAASKGGRIFPLFSRRGKK